MTRTEELLDRQRQFDQLALRHPEVLPDPTEARLIRSVLRDTVPNARELERFEMGDAQPVAGVLNYRGGPEKGVKVQCYLSAGESELVALKPKKVTKAGGGVEVGAIVLKVAWHGPLDKVLGFMPS